jgi:hypothetical protein
MNVWTAAEVTQNKVSVFLSDIGLNPQRVHPSMGV